MRSPTRVWRVCVGQSAFVSVPKMNGSPRAEYKDDAIKILKTAVLIWFQWKNIRFDYGILCFQINKRWNINWNDFSISSDWPNLCPTVDIYISTWSGCQCWEWPQIAPLKKGAGSTDLAPCFDSWTIRSLWGQTNSQVCGNIIRYGNIGSPQALSWIEGLLNWLGKKNPTHSRSQIRMQSQQRWTPDWLDPTPLQKNANFMNDCKCAKAIFCVLSCLLWY